MLSPVMFTFQRDGSQVLEKDILDHEADKKGLFSFQKGIQLSLGICKGLVPGPATDSANLRLCSAL